MADKTTKISKSSRKHGRNLKKPSKMRYVSSKRWITNKARRIWKYMKKHPNWKPNNLSDGVKVELKRLAKSGGMKL